MPSPRPTSDLDMVSRKIRSRCGGLTEIRPITNSDDLCSDDTCSVDSNSHQTTKVVQVMHEMIKHVPLRSGILLRLLEID